MYKCNDNYLGDEVDQEILVHILKYISYNKDMRLLINAICAVHKESLNCVNKFFIDGIVI